ncbi:MAG: ATP-binding cassette domain-containing protein, partial [Actinomycetota bacterium]|nr:ATP-binding cassette domain-containing protein [Actinomycetota bacterium]
MSIPVLRLSGVQKRFGGRQVLTGVDLEIQGGEIVALVGENGAGKSTLVHCIARSFPADTGTFELGGRRLAPDATGVRRQGVAVVWQDLALCDNLSVVANLFLGTERLDRMLLDEAAMAAEAKAVFARLGVPMTDVAQPVGSLSGGQRQLVAMARAVMQQPAILLLDEPTAALGVAEGRLVDGMLEQLRAGGTAVLLVSHRLEQVFNLADRIAVLRDGRIVAEVSPLEVHPDDVVAMISGVEADSTARRQLRRLRSLVDQLAEAGPAASLPLIVSAMAEALGVDQLCVHLLDQPDHGQARLRRSAAVGLRGPLFDAVESLPIGGSGGPPGMAAATGEVVVVEDTRNDPRWDRFRLEDRRGGPRSAWSVPITGAAGVLGTISGYAGTVGRPQSDQMELVSLYASHAAAAIDRERLLADATRRNRVLETLRGVLDSLAGPLPARGGLTVALAALGRGLGADAIAFHTPAGEQS